MVVIVTGPTAVGKTSIAALAAREAGGEVVCADSRQLFRGMEVGAANPDASVLGMVPHHLYGALDPGEPVSAGRYREMARAAISGILERGAIPFVVGGTGLYLRALTGAIALAPQVGEAVTTRISAEAASVGNRGMWERLLECDPATAARLEPGDRYRIIRALAVLEDTGRPLSAWLKERTVTKLESCKVALTLERGILYERINRRCREMVDRGMVEEARRLLERFGDGPYPGSIKAIGYRHLFRYLEGRASLPEALELLSRDTRRYAKRQMTWLRGEKDLAWVDAMDAGKAVRTIAGIAAGARGRKSHKCA
jgi:tRNA dimethylallyltransferase